MYKNVVHFHTPSLLLPWSHLLCPPLDPLLTYLPLSCQSSMPLPTLCLFNKTHKNFSPLVHLLLPNIPDLPPHVPLIKCPSFTFPRPFPQNVHFYSPPLRRLFVPRILSLSIKTTSVTSHIPLSHISPTYLPHIPLHQCLPLMSLSHIFLFPMYSSSCPLT